MVKKRKARGARLPTRCILHYGKASPKGYGKRWCPICQTGQGAHHVAWAIHYGEPPEGYDVHHICENKMCVNPGHLQLLPHGKHSVLTRGVRQGRCQRGHRFSGHQCRECKRLTRRAFYLRTEKGNRDRPKGPVGRPKGSRNIPLDTPTQDME